MFVRPLSQGKEHVTLAEWKYLVLRRLFESGKTRLVRQIQGLRFGIVQRSFLVKDVYRLSKRVTVPAAGAISTVAPRAFSRN